LVMHHTPRAYLPLSGWTGSSAQSSWDTRMVGGGRRERGDKRLGEIVANIACMLIVARWLLVKINI